MRSRIFAKKYFAENNLKPAYQNKIFTSIKKALKAIKAFSQKIDHHFIIKLNGQDHCEGSP